VIKTYFDYWLHLEEPSADELAQTSQHTGIPIDDLSSALDEDETAYFNVDGDIKLLVIDIPEMGENGYTQTLPLALIETKDYLVSVCSSSTPALSSFINKRTKTNSAASKSKLVYQLLLNNSRRFLYYLKQIDKQSEAIQKTLSKSLKNQEVLQLVEIQKSLVYISSSLSANYSVIQKIAYHASKSPEDERDIIQEIVLETKQAIAMCSVYREIIKSTMDAFASVVNNNQNTIMKLLTAITIILSIPMVIASLWGMNTGVPFETYLWGFWAVVGISVTLTAVAAVIMIKRKLF
jgi:magnesium transporter